MNPRLQLFDLKLENAVLLNKTYPADIKTIVILTNLQNLLMLCLIYPDIDPCFCRRGLKVPSELTGVSFFSSAKNGSSAIQTQRSTES